MPLVGSRPRAAVDRAAVDLVGGGQLGRCLMRRDQGRAERDLPGRTHVERHVRAQLRHQQIVDEWGVHQPAAQQDRVEVGGVYRH